MIIFGDVHGEFASMSWHIKQILKKYPNENNVLVCGDFGYWPGRVKFQDIKIPKNMKIYFCDGNHERHDLLENFTEESNEIIPQVFYQKRGSVVEIENKKVLFFGGANSIDKEYRTPYLDWFPQENITESQINNLPETDIDIVISHTCPKEFELPLYQMTDKLTDVNRKYLSIILNKYKPSLYFFGHWHLNTEGMYKNTKYFGIDRVNGSRSCYLIHKEI